jgi:predicted dehydrogenase
MDASQRLTIGIVGAGQIVETNHAPVLKALGHDVLWIVDNNLTKARTLASFLKCRAYSSIDDLSQATPPDVVLLACPYGARHGYYAFLANHFPDSALLIEKPIALTMAEHESIETLRAPYKVGAFYSRRVTSMVTHVKRMISERLLGDVRRCSIGYGGIGMLTLGRYVSNIAMAGGGTLFDNAIHELEVLRGLSWLEPASSRDATIR